MTEKEKKLEALKDELAYYQRYMALVCPYGDNTFEWLIKECKKEILALESE